MFRRSARDLGTGQGLEPKGYFVYLEATNRRAGTRDPLSGKQRYRRDIPIKRERGEWLHSPRCSSRFAKNELYFPYGHPRICSSGGQNLAALCTAAGQDLTAVGSGHSLAETMDLGTMALGGLVGTLHTRYTSCQNFNMLDSQKAAATHSN